VGDIDADIRRAITAQKADVVVMGTHGRRGFERWVMGSVTERLMRNCPVPLLAIRAAKTGAAAPPAIRRILVTTDFSDGTTNALDYAFSIAQECQARITLLHVMDDIALAEVSVKRRVPLVNDIRRKLDELVPEEVRAWCDVDAIVENGTPYVVIQDILKSQKPGLLVMNVHGKNLVDRALIGSTAERVLRAADCPVLLIPPKAAVKKSARKKPTQSAGKEAA
jgi:nucleotide-binding universal stress UspA family protein